MHNRRTPASVNGAVVVPFLPENLSIQRQTCSPKIPEMNVYSFAIKTRSWTCVAILPVNLRVRGT